MGWASNNILGPEVRLSTGDRYSDEAEWQSGLSEQTAPKSSQITRNLR